MKAIYTKILARKILIAFLAFVIIISVSALFVRKTITEKLENISKFANGIRRDQSKPEQILLLLHQAENEFQESLLKADSGKSADYKSKLSQAFDEIDTLLKERADTVHLTSNQRGELKLWYQKKLELSGQLYQLKHDFDSLLTAYADYNLQSGRNLPNLITSDHHRKKTSSNNTDTVKKSVSAQKKGLFRRLKDAIVNKNDPSAPKEVLEINHNKKTNLVDQTTQQVMARNTIAYANQLKQLQQRNLMLLEMQKKLILLNTHIANELERIINDIKEINYNVANEFRDLAFKNYRDTTELLNKFYLAALFLVLLFALLLIVFIIQLNKSELLLRQENERSVTIARQKMDLLLHMSHEIRNPLTAIKGFLFIFSKTNLTQKQVEMLNSIRHSSDMLLRTLNDTLDAAKMENSEFKINVERFNPDLIFKNVIESMEFSATKKNLALNYVFKGDKEGIISGDSFRLKQIMVNLLSNAIKYTAKGSVTVVAELNSNESRLQVEVTDTGAGISLEQQADLFSKYHQTNSAKGKGGSGLGLFICKQLIALQGGQITVKSQPESGSTFSFFIPYQKVELNSATDQQLIDPILLLNGLTVLAVDDNEVNLMLLKMMLNKWNVKFLQSTNGKEALDIISVNPVSIVLTDLQMPEMDGIELLTALKKSNTPVSQVPVIVLSGSTEPEDEHKYLKMGFAGVIGKPFTREQLVNQLMKVLKH